jgi:hypothetical protein
MNLLIFLLLIAGLLMSAVLIGAKKCPVIIAGDVTIDQKGLKECLFFPIRHYRIGGKRINPNDYHLIGKLRGESLEPFGLPDKATVFCDFINGKVAKRNDVVVIETTSERNKGRLKGRVVLGFWGDPNKPDQDLIKFENFSGTVKDFFEIESKRKYNYNDNEIYFGPYEGMLKTLSFDRNQSGLKVSRPHSPEKVLARIASAA